MSIQPAPAQPKSVLLAEARRRVRVLANELPMRPGVYIMRDERGGIVYVGKAVNLRRRVGSYATPSVTRDRKVSRLVNCVRSLSYITVNSELEALLIESRLIKAHQPQFNRQLIDPESCCFLRADFTQRIPRVEVVRYIRDDDADYLGPFWNSSFVHAAVEAVANTFSLRRCSTPRGGTCMYAELGRCSGPCSGRVSVDEYRRAVTSAWRSLAGESDEAGRLLIERREWLADQLRFEDAHAVHRQIRALGQVASSVPDPSVLEGTFAVVVPSYLRGRPVVLMFRDNRLMSTSLCGPRAYPDLEITCEQLLRLCKQCDDYLPGKPSRDDQLIIHSHLHRRHAPGALVPLPSHKSVRHLADSILAAIDAVRRG